MPRCNSSLPPATLATPRCSSQTVADPPCPALHVSRRQHEVLLIVAKDRSLFLRGCCSVGLLATDPKQRCTYCLFTDISRHQHWALSTSLSVFVYLYLFVYCMYLCMFACLVLGFIFFYLFVLCVCTPLCVWVWKCACVCLFVCACGIDHAFVRVMLDMVQ